MLYERKGCRIEGSCPMLSDRAWGGGRNERRRMKEIWKEGSISNVEVMEVAVGEMKSEDICWRSSEVVVNAVDGKTWPGRIGESRRRSGKEGRKAAAPDDGWD